MGNPYQAPKHDRVDEVPGVNRQHTAVFGVLFVVLVFGAPLLIGGLVGLIVAPMVGAALWGLYRLTLPPGPKRSSIAETAGGTACPACGSLQTDRRQFATPEQPPWQCFACGHDW
jgi:predicted RNA-binding Zn-ribbon protein involved in translation (DUF1610 family)